MKMLRTILLASAFAAGTMFPASAQINPAPQPGSPGATGPISAATHCIDSMGNVRLKTGSATTGSGTGPVVQSPGSAGSSSGAIGGANTAAQNLPKC